MVWAARAAGSAPGEGESWSGETIGLGVVVKVRVGVGVFARFRGIDERRRVVRGFDIVVLGGLKLCSEVAVSEADGMRRGRHGVGSPDWELRRLLEREVR